MKNSKKVLELDKISFLNKETLCQILENKWSTEGCDCQLDLPSSQSVNSLVSNREHNIFVAVTDTFLYFFLADTHLLACIYQREDDDIAERGFFRKAYWKPDSTAIAVTTSKNFVSILNVEISRESSFNLHDPVGESTDFTRESTELFMNKSRPNINVNLAVVARLESTPTWFPNLISILTFKEELIVCLKDGWLHRLSWSGNILHELSFNINSIHHEQTSTKSSFKNILFSTFYLDQRKDFGYFVSDISPFLGGICIVYSDGRAALVISSISEFRPGSISILFAGGPSGDAFAVLWDSTFPIEQNRAFNNNTDNLDVEGVSRIFTKTNGDHMSCPPVLAIFSPFGEQWWCSLDDNKTVAPGKNPQSPTFDNYEYTSMDWSLEGYQLWLGTSNANLHLINIVRSMQNIHDAMVLVGSDRILVCPTNQDKYIASHLIWQLIKPPHGYITTNWPIKHVSISKYIDSDKILVVGGSHGFCFFNFRTTKWRMFRKEAEEKSLLLTGGLNIFESFIICAACNLDSKDERLYIFQLEDQLDVDLAHFISTNRILQMKICSSFLLTFGVDSMISIYSLSVLNTKQLQIECIAEIRVAEFLHHPNFSFCLNPLFIYHDFSLLRLVLLDALSFCSDLDSLLINASGHLLLLSPMVQQLNGQHSNESILEFQLHPPTLVASYVEEFWIMHPFFCASSGDEKYNITIPYLSEALWINAGYIDHNYLACGANVTSMSFSNFNSKITSADDISITLSEDDSSNGFISIATTEEVAALSVRNLTKTYEVLIVNLQNLYPLLPRVVSFLREFPDEYLPTIIHCARKTELAYWNVLFFVSNHPRQLFQMCLDEDLLEYVAICEIDQMFIFRLATSCLVILHSLTSIGESSRFACKLLEKAKRKQRWQVAQDIIRFMQNINRATEKDSDLGSMPTSPIQGKLTSLHHQHVTPPFNLSNDELSFPLFSSQVEIEPSSAQQRKISGSGKSTDPSRHVTAYTGIRRLN
uniref:Protein RIC1 homolog n=1 Tax=Meloidogyne hapla TaxID=6305 RepID=A0A1I8BN27_MELHA